MLLSLVPEYSEAYVPLCLQGVLPLSLNNCFYKKENLDLTYPHLLAKCEEI